MELFYIQAAKLDDDHPVQIPHFHMEYEIYCFLSGDATCSVEGITYNLAPGDILLMRDSETHHLILKNNTPYKRITVHFKPVCDLPQDMIQTFLAAFTDRPIGLFNFYSSSVFNVDQWLYYLNQICAESNKTKQQAYLLVLLAELSSSLPLVKKVAHTPNLNLIGQVTHYIDRHLADPLTLDALCERFFISSAQLTRKFKSNIGTTIGDYILTKRLMLAKKLIEAGEKPTTAYLKCGFNDYSAFFRMYKKHFGCSPKGTNSASYRTTATLWDHSLDKKLT